MNRKSGIREWAVIKDVAHYGEDVTIDGRTERVGAKLEVKHPVFNDGNTGRPVLELTIFKDSWTFRFRVPREGDDEASRISAIMSAMVNENLAAGKAALEEAWAAYEKEREQEKQERIKDHNEVMEQEKRRSGRKSKNAGQGLGKYSKPGKTRRSRSKKHGESRAQ